MSIKIEITIDPKILEILGKIIQIPKENPQEKKPEKIKKIVPEAKKIQKKKSAAAQKKPKKHTYKEKKEKIKDFFDTHSEITTRQAGELFNRTPESAWMILSKLEKDGFLLKGERKQKGKKSIKIWFLTPREPYKPSKEELKENAKQFAERNGKNNSHIEIVPDIACPECEGNGRIIEDKTTGDCVCDNCGVVYGKTFSSLPERRAYDAKQRKERVRYGPPLTERLHDKGLGTTIDRRFKDINNRNLDPKTVSKYWRIINWHSRLKIADAKNRNLTIANSLIGKYAATLEIPNLSVIIDYAAIIYKKCVYAEFVKGRRIETVSAACLYVSCRTYGRVVSLKEMAKKTQESKKYVQKCYRAIVEAFDLSDLVRFVPSDFVPGIISKLKLPILIENKTYKILKMFGEKNTLSKNPIGIAGGAVYCAVKLLDVRNSEGFRISQEIVSEAADISEVTIRTNAKLIMGLLGVEGRKEIMSNNDSTPIIPNTNKIEVNS